MADEAILLMAFSNIGLVPDSGGSWFLARAVGYSRAFEIAATGRRVDAAEALALGLVQQVVPADELLPDGAPSWRPTLAARPTRRIAWTKRLMRGGADGHARGDDRVGGAAAGRRRPLATTTGGRRRRSSRSGHPAFEGR